MSDYDDAEWSAWRDQMAEGKPEAWAPTNVMYHLRLAQQEIDRLSELGAGGRGGHDD